MKKRNIAAILLTGALSLSLLAGCGANQGKQEAAVSTIQCLIRELNPKVENLTIDVEFY